MNLFLRQKPARWALSHGAVNPSCRWVWRSLVSAWLFWEGGGVAYDTVRHTPTVPINSPSWTATLAGLGIHTTNASVGLQLTDALTLDNWTVVWVGVPRSVGFNSDRSLLGADDFGETDLTAGRDTVSLKESGGVGVTSGRIEVNVAGTGGLLDNFGLTQDEINTVVITRQGSLASVYLDGRLTGTIAVGTGTGRIYQYWRLGCHRFSGSDQEFGIADHNLVLVANEAWPSGQVARFSRDPFGAFRMVDEARIVYDLGGTIITAAATLPATATLAATAIRSALAAATLSGTTTLAGAGVLARFAQAALSAVATLAGTATRTTFGQAALSTTATLSATALRILLAAGNLSATATSSATSLVERFAQATLTAVATLRGTAITALIPAATVYAVARTTTVQAVRRTTTVLARTRTILVKAVKR